jgi:phosphohistidine phosphatase SixA
MRLFLMSIACLSALVGGSAGAQEPDIWRQLQKGGYVILMRHGAVDSLSRSTSPDADFEACEGQYNLTELGRAQALLIGDFLRKRKTAIGGVLASPLCRTRDTARIAFGTYRAWEVLEPLPEQEGPERARRIEATTKLIAGHVGRDNLILVTHQPNIDALTLEMVEPATMLVLKPDGRGGFALMRKIVVGDLVKPVP